MYNTMTREQVYQFIDDHALTAHLATVRANGKPHVAPVWIATDGDDIIWLTDVNSVKGKTLQREQYAAISIDDSTPPFNSVRLEGPVTFSEDLDDLRHWGAITGGRYMGEDRAEEFGKRNGVPGEMVCRMHPEKVSGLIDVAE